MTELIIFLIQTAAIFLCGMFFSEHAKQVARERSEEKRKGE